MNTLSLILSIAAFAISLGAAGFMALSMARAAKNGDESRVGNTDVLFDRAEENRE